jgi:REP element-mobilizing transposase RayT
MPQSLSGVYIHLIFSTKNREGLITPGVEPELHAFLVGSLRDLGCPSLRVNGTADHVHCLFVLARTVAICDVVERVKRASSRWIKTKGPMFRGFAWQHGYGAFSVSESNIEGVKAYIDRQKDRHATRSFQDEYRSFLRKHNIVFDERYVWD